MHGGSEGGSQHCLGSLVVAEFVIASLETTLMPCLAALTEGSFLMQQLRQPYG